MTCDFSSQRSTAQSDPHLPVDWLLKMDVDQEQCPLVDAFLDMQDVHWDQNLAVDMVLKISQAR